VLFANETLGRLWGGTNIIFHFTKPESPKH
ncbi:MAG: hypothetical protein JWM53_6021, partial [bacterium]|nr:hypothetical protein [bacterium]